MSNDFLAYGSDRHALETVMRVQAIKRWHMIGTSRIQTLAEHSANVAMLVMLITKTATIEFFDTYTHAACYALLHDVSEAFTGDIPSPTKKHLAGIDELEYRTTHPDWKIYARASTVLLTKMCDLADGIRFIRLYGVDITGVHAKTGLEEKFKEVFKIATLDHLWPEHIIEHVRNNLVFYAYEQP